MARLIGPDFGESFRNDVLTAVLMDVLMAIACPGPNPPCWCALTSGQSIEKRIFSVESLYFVLHFSTSLRSVWSYYAKLSDILDLASRLASGF